MGQRLSDVIEDKYIYCECCNTKFLVKDMEYEDWNFAWDNNVTDDCCNKCYPKYKTKDDFTVFNLYKVTPSNKVNNEL